MEVARLERWFLTQQERGNPASRIDTRRSGDAAWATGNRVTALPHGATYFTELLGEVRRLGKGDLLLFTDWRGDPDERLDGPGTEVASVFADAARRGVIVKGLLWRSHLDRFQFSAEENRHLGDDIEAGGGECLRDMRVRTGGCHHQKFVVVRHRGHPELDVAFVGGIDLCHSRRDTAEHRGDPQASRISAVYTGRPPWHDVQVAIRGPAVGDVEATFRERWEDPTPLTRNPVHRIADRLRREDTRPDALPAQWPDPEPCGRHAVQLLRTYPFRRHGFPFAPKGEHSIARAYRKALRGARSLVYLEDQYLWSPQVAQHFADALVENPRLRLLAVVPGYPDSDGRLSRSSQLYGRASALESLRRAGGSRVAVYSLENREGTPVYVHAKVCVVYDAWTAVGSDNLNLRSWTYDSELACAVLDADERFARQLRITLASEHLERAEGDHADLVDAESAFEAFAESAAALDAWHDGGRHGPRPPGRLRAYRIAEMSRWTRTWAGLLYRLVYDPDGRPRYLRRGGEF